MSNISAVKEMDIKNDTYNVMFKKVDHNKLGACPKVKMKKPAPELINLKPTEPERKSVRSRDIVNKGADCCFWSASIRKFTLLLGV